MTLVAHAQTARRRFTAVVAAAALALAGLAATSSPARASNHDDIIRFLLGAAAVAVILRAVEGQGSGYYIDRWTLPDACLETMRVRGRTADVYHRGCLNRAGYTSLPGHCQVSLNTDRGRRIGYEAHCLYDAGYRGEWGGGHYRPRPVEPVHPWQPPRQPGWGSGWSALPEHCELTYRQGNQRLRGYDARCLRDAGLRNLPQHCVVTARDGQRIYTAQCLSDAGYRRR